MSNRLDEQIAAIAAAHHGLFARHHLAELDVTAEERRHRLDTGRWAAVHDSAYRVAGAPVTWKASLLAACWAGGVRAVVSHRAAAAMYTLPGGSTDVIELAIEYESYQEHTGKVALVRDSARRNVLAALGFTTLTATAADLRDDARALARAVRRVRAVAA